MYPVAASGTARQTEQDMVMNGYIIPAGTVLVVPLYPLLNSPHVWECPEEFRPVRLTPLTPSMISWRARASPLKSWCCWHVIGSVAGR